MKKIFFVSPDQFGYTIDFYNYCEYLKESYQILFICPDMGQDRIEMENIEVHYIREYQSGLRFKIQFIIDACALINSNNPDLVYINYFPLCSLMSIFLRTKEINIDIRTGTIDDNEKRRIVKNKLMKYEANRFKYITTISEGISNELGFNKVKTTIIPLGADRLNEQGEKQLFSSNNFRLLYIGTLNKRNIDETIKGFALFLSKHKKELNAIYTIIGYSSFGEEQIIQNTISEFSLHDYVFFLGRKKYNDLQKYFESHDIGVSYVPIKNYFQHQPPTKTYEYIQNGLVCIATETIENAKIINEKNGVLIKDSGQAFFEGLEYIYLNRDRYIAKDIMKQGESFTWKHIVNNILKFYIERILNKKER